MITGVAFCPHPPVLVPEVAGTAASELDALRGACRTAIQRVSVPGVRIVVVGSGDRNAAFPANARGSLHGYGVPIEVPLGSEEPGLLDLPLSLTIGAWLLRDALGPNSGAIGRSVRPEGPDLPPFHDDVPTALLVMGDGSARRSEKAPGYLDRRAAGFDAGIASALACGDGSELHDVYDAGSGQLIRIDDSHTSLGCQLLASGIHVWAAAASLIEAQFWDAELLYDAAPYGVGYFVAAWTQRG
ncbi:MAG: hypothetical protein ACR2LX_13795 [Jatrophihabitans sp.]